MQRIRRVVTGHDEQGRSKVILDGDADTTLDIGYGNAVTEIWSIFEALPSNAGSEDSALSARKYRTPPPLGYKLRIVEFAPDEEVDLAAMNQRLAKNMSEGRMLGSVKGDLHRSETVDCNIVIRGEVWHETDLDEVHLKAGDILIQRGTYHVWRNRSRDPVMIAVLLHDAQPLDPASVTASRAVRKTEASEALANWIAAVNTGSRSPSLLRVLYDEDAVISLPHNDGWIIAAEQSFDRITGTPSQEQVFRCEVENFVCQPSADGAAVTGIYSTHFVSRGGRPISTRYRFSFVYRKRAQGLVIVSHHTALVS